MPEGVDAVECVPWLDSLPQKCVVRSFGVGGRDGGGGSGSSKLCVSCGLLLCSKVQGLRIVHSLASVMTRGILNGQTSVLCFRQGGCVDKCQVGISITGVQIVD